MHPQGQEVAAHAPLVSSATKMTLGKFCGPSLVERERTRSVEMNAQVRRLANLHAPLTLQTD